MNLFSSCIYFRKDIKKKQQHHFFSFFLCLVFKENRSNANIFRAIPYVSSSVEKQFAQRINQTVDSDTDLISVQESNPLALWGPWLPSTKNTEGAAGLTTTLVTKQVGKEYQQAWLHTSVCWDIRYWVSFSLAPEQVGSGGRTLD